MRNRGGAQQELHPSTVHQRSTAIIVQRLCAFFMNVASYRSCAGTVRHLQLMSPSSWSLRTRLSSLRLFGWQERTATWNTTNNHNREITSDRPQMGASPIATMDTTTKKLQLVLVPLEAVVEERFTLWQFVLHAVRVVSLNVNPSTQPSTQPTLANLCERRR